MAGSFTMMCLLVRCVVLFHMDFTDISWLCDSLDELSEDFQSFFSKCSSCPIALPCPSPPTLSSPSLPSPPLPGFQYTQAVVHVLSCGSCFLGFKLLCTLPFLCFNLGMFLSPPPHLRYVYVLMFVCKCVHTWRPDTA